MLRTLLVVFSILVFQVLTTVAETSTNCDNNVGYATDFFNALSATTPLPLIRASYATTYSGYAVSSTQPNMYNPIPTNIDDLMGFWAYFYNSWDVNSTTNDVLDCLEDGRVFLRTSQSLTHKTSKKYITDSISWYLLTFDTDGKITFFEDTWNNLLVYAAEQTSSGARVTASLPNNERTVAEITCDNTTAVLMEFGDAISKKNVTQVLSFYDMTFEGITPSFELPTLYVPVGNITSQAGGWEYFFNAWTFDGAPVFEVVCSDDNLGVAFFRHQQNMTSTVTGNKVYFSQSWYYISINDDLKITRIDNTWNTLLESQASTPAVATTGPETSGSPASQFSVVILVITAFMTYMFKQI